MARTTDEVAIIKDAIGAFCRATGIDATVDTGGEQADRPVGEVWADTVIRVAKAGKKWDYLAEVKPWLTTAAIGLLADRFRASRKMLLVTRHVTPPVAEKLRELQVQFMDTDGNAFLDTHDLLVYVKGQRATKGRTEPGLGRPFKAAGMQVIFAFLCNPGLERKTYREIAEVTRTALGTIDWTMQDLRQIGHILRIGRTDRKIIKREALFDKWVAAYPQQLRPRNFIGRYAAPRDEWWRTADLKGLNVFWGGETGAAKTTGYLQPEIATLYLDGNANDLTLRFKLKKDPDGNVELFRKFWGFQEEDTTKQIVPLPLIYADLLATGITRNIETAQELRKGYLDRYLKDY